MSSTASLPDATPPLSDAGAPPTPEAWAAAFAVALPYDHFLDRHATPDQKERWDAFHARVELSDVNQCPIFAHFASASPAIDLRLLDRDALPEIAAHLKVCGGQRVPVAAFFSEDFTPILFYGDRTLSAYRAASTQLGSSCPTGAVPPPSDAIAAVVADWLDQFERVHHILRLSARLRQKHGD
jgi:hypothetical protein